MSHKAEFSDDGGKSFASNALRFATEAEAKAYGDNLFMRWLGATDHRVAPSDDPVSHVWRDGKLIKKEDDHD